jgi:hypothetical protein
MSNTTATELIARMRALYASVHTYADRGTASTILGPRVTFQTSFTRGHRLRFEFGREHQSRVIWSVNKEHDWTVIWSDGEHTYTHWTLAARIGEPELIDDGRDIGGAIAAARHMSSLSASTVPALLLPVSVGSAFSTLAEISELNHDRDEYIGRSLCVRGSTRIMRSEVERRCGSNVRRACFAASSQPARRGSERRSTMSHPFIRSTWGTWNALTSRRCSRSRENLGHGLALVSKTFRDASLEWNRVARQAARVSQ